MWDCAKAYLQGHIIAFVSEKKKEREHKQQQLENTIRKLEQQHKRTPTPVLLTELTVALRELNTLISNGMEGRLRFVKQKYYEYGNGASRLFALHLKEQQSTNIVSKLKSKNSSTLLKKKTKKLLKSLLISISPCIKILIHVQIILSGNKMFFGKYAVTTINRIYEIRIRLQKRRFWK